MSPFPCGCEPGLSACEVAQRLFRAWRAAEDIERELFIATTAGENADDIIIHQRWELASDHKRKAYRKYQRHVDGEDVTPEPQSLKVVIPPPPPPEFDPDTNKVIGTIPFKPLRPAS